MKLIPDDGTLDVQVLVYCAISIVNKQQASSITVRKEKKYVYH